MDNAFYGIYVTVNEITEEKYLGQHCTFNINDGYLGSGKLLQKAIKKYGSENFKRYYIDECKDIFELAKKEYEWLRKFDAVNSPEWYNDSYICSPNYCFEYGLTYVHKKKIKDNHAHYWLGKEGGRKGNTNTEETRKKISKALTGKKHSEERKKAKSIYQTGLKHKPHKKHKSFPGHKQTEETKEKLRNN